MTLFFLVIFLISLGAAARYFVPRYRQSWGLRIALITIFIISILILVFLLR